MQEACCMLQCLECLLCELSSFAADRARPECSGRPPPKTMTGCEAPEAMKPEANELKGKAVIAIQSFTKKKLH